MIEDEKDTEDALSEFIETLEMTLRQERVTAATKFDQWARGKDLHIGVVKRTEQVLKVGMR